jgi:hypothetical protein
MYDDHSEPLRSPAVATNAAWKEASARHIHDGLAISSDAIAPIFQTACDMKVGRGPGIEPVHGRVSAELYVAIVLPRLDGALSPPQREMNMPRSPPRLRLVLVSVFPPGLAVARTTLPPAAGTSAASAMNALDGKWDGSYDGRQGFLSPSAGYWIGHLK